MDSRLIILVGLALLAASMLQMSHYSLTMSSQPIILAGVVQGLGMGLMFVPLSTLAFSTLPPALRTEGAGLFTLVRNVGSSVGISILSAVQTQNSEIAHAEMIPHIRPDNPVIAAMPHPVNFADPASLAAVNGQITRQAAMLAYVDSFRLIMLICFVAMPMLLVMKNPKRAPAGEIHAAVE